MDQPEFVTETTVIAAKFAAIGSIGLNRPRALNALDPAMVHAISAALAGWQADDDIAGVVVHSTGGAFCAGGDIRLVRSLVLSEQAPKAEDFFRAEYALNRQMAEYAKPIIALIDGICMGGGIGISVHGAIRVVTEAALLAMPEIAIGMFPDVGASHVLPRLPGALGMYLALTGARLSGGDAVHAGLATHVVPRNRLAGLHTALREAPAGTSAAGLRALVEAASAPPPAFTLAAELPLIARCFSAGSVADIVARLHAEPGDFAATALAMLLAGSPTAVLTSFTLMQAGRTRSLAECLDADFRMARKMTRHADFLEGVRAMVVDKDRTPHWSPARLDAAEALRDS